jgi:DNA mismatch endonuclease (patch repair protein)
MNMSDTFTKRKRSKTMSLIRSTGNKSTEIGLIQALRNNKITGWSRKSKLFGKPDIVFKKHKLAIFIDGCFGHKCPIHFRMPGSNHHYWKHKIASNTRRDRKVTRTLKLMGWKVIRIWEHDIRKNLDKYIKNIDNIVNK